MLTVFNIVIIALVLLIAYWWANQGLFSAFLHLICVIAAGAVALAVWEPLTTRLLLRGNAFDNYAWGVSLVGVFAIALLVFRVIMDKLVPGNVNLPQWANLVFGFPIGAAAGVITMGIVFIGAGFVQSSRDIMGYVGAGRTERDASVQEIQSLWAPVHEWTYDLYSWLSVSSLSTSQPLRHVNPNLHLQAASLVRDTAVDGRGKVALRPADARVNGVRRSTETNRYAVSVTFLAGARDWGEQLTLSSSQVRLIGDARGMTEAAVAHPDSFTQHSGHHRFDHRSHYITSEPSQAEATVEIEFDGRKLAGQPAKYIQIRGTRYLLPKPQEMSDYEFTSNRSAGPRELVSVDTDAPSIQQAVEISNDIRPVQMSTNMKPTGIELTEDRYISSGDGEMPRRGVGRISQALSVKGIYEPEGTRMVRVNVSRGGIADIFSTRVRNRAKDTDTIMLVDRNGRTYLPVGFLHDRPDDVTRIVVDYQAFVSTPAQLPVLPTSNDHVLRLLFSVQTGAEIVGLKVGDVTVGTCSVPVRAREGIKTAEEAAAAANAPVDAGSAKVGAGGG